MVVAVINSLNTKEIFMTNSTTNILKSKFGLPLAVLAAALSAAFFLTACGGGSSGGGPGSVPIPTGIEVTTQPRAAYRVGTGFFNPYGMVITVFYDNHTTLDIPFSGNEHLIDITWGNKSWHDNDGFADVTAEEGKKTITVWYQGFYDSFDIEIVPSTAVVQKLRVHTPPNLLAYFVNDEFNPAGTRVEGEYYFGVYPPSPFWAFLAYDADLAFQLYQEGGNPDADEPSTMTVPGKKDVYVSYEEIRTTEPFSITVLPIETTHITATPDRVAYFTGDTFDPQSITVMAFNNQGNSYRVLFEEFSVALNEAPVTDNMLLETAGGKVFTVTYEGFEDTVSITVTELALVSIHIKQSPTTLGYEFGGAVNLSGLELTGLYNNSASQDIVYGDAEGITMHNPPNMNEAGVYDVYIAYNDLITDNYFTITVAEQAPATVSFNTGAGSSDSIPSQSVPIGEKAVAPGIPQALPYPFSVTGLFRGGDYIFDGWFAAGALEQFDFSATAITGDITIQARWVQPEQVALHPNFTFTTTSATDAIPSATIVNNNSAELGRVLTHVNANPTEEFVFVVDVSAAGTNVIYIPGFASFALPPTTANPTRTINGHLELRGAFDKPVQRFRLSSNGFMFNVGDGGRFTLGSGITLQGRHNSTTSSTSISARIPELPARGDNNRPLVRVNSGGIFTMQAGSMLQGNRSVLDTTAPGSGAHIASGGTFVMRGGRLDSLGFSDGNSSTPSTGGAVHIASGGTFEMRGGEMTWNRASLGAWGAAIANEGGVFRMSHGWIPGSERGNDGNANLGNSTSTAGRGGVLRHRTNTANAVSEWGTFNEDGSFTRGGVFASGQIHNRDNGILIVNGQSMTPPATDRPAAFPAP